MADLMKALRNADAAGDTEAAKRIAAMIREQRSGSQSADVDQEQDSTIGDMAASVLEPAAAIGSSAILTPVAGLAGLATQVPESMGLIDQGTAGSVVESVQDFAYEPRTEAGKSAMGVVSDIAGSAAQRSNEAISFIKDLATGNTLEESILKLNEPDAITEKGVSQAMGDKVLEETGSPALAALATAIPTAAMEALGYKLGRVSGKGIKPKVQAKAPLTKQIKDSIIESAPTVDQLKKTSRGLYDELTESGVMLKPAPYARMRRKITNELDSKGYDAEINPEIKASIARLNNSVGKSVNLVEIDNIRKVAQNAAGSQSASTRMLAQTMISEIDEFLDSVPQRSLTSGSMDAAQIGKKYKAARNLWGRAKKSEMINEAFDKASRQASGFENGIVIQFRSILNNKNKRKFLNRSDIKAMDSVVKGGTLEDIAKAVGKLGIKEGHNTSLVGPAIGATGGAAVLGPFGAVAVPAIGQLSKNLSQRLTKGKADFAEALARAGKDAKAITEAYLANTPKGKRSSAELSQLLMSEKIDLSDAMKSKNSILRSASEKAMNKRALAGIIAAGETGEIANQDSEQ